MPDQRPAFDIPPAVFATARQPVRLEGNDVHLWSVELDSQSLSKALEVLSVDERDRTSRFHFDTHRCRYASAHAALRWILGGYLEKDPAAVQVVGEEGAKPRLADAALEFNLSHSQNQAWIAVSRKTKVGVDLEHPREMHDLLGLTSRFFSPEEHRDIASLDPQLRPLAFRVCWTRKEAYVKALGVGIAYGLDGFVAGITPMDRVIPPLSSRPPVWLHSLAENGGAVGALGCVGGPQQIQCLAFSPR